jgi:catechol 2,3-dioxygenase
MNMDYKIDNGARIGHVHLKVSDIGKSLDFYCNILGFKLMARMGEDAAFVSAGGYHHHIGLNTWFSKGGLPAPQSTTGLFHVAIVYPSRKALALAIKNLRFHQYPISGAADHGVSEAIYLDDPDGNGLELYCDRLQNEWPHDPEGKLEMYTKHLDIEDLLKEAEN